jgi:transposase
MNKRITVKPHESIEDIEARYRKAKDLVERSHWQIIWLLAQGKTTGEVAEVTGYCASWIRSISHRYNNEGPAGLGDRRHSNPGGTFILSTEQQEQLEQDLDAGAPDGGLWTGPKVARWIEVHTGRKVHPQRGWEYLKRLGYSKRVLRPRHAKADPAVQEAFKKNFLSREKPSNRPTQRPPSNCGPPINTGLG